jgi:hypothetical protein
VPLIKVRPKLLYQVPAGTLYGSFLFASTLPIGMPFISQCIRTPWIFARFPSPTENGTKLSKMMRAGGFHVPRVAVEIKSIVFAFTLFPVLLY